jgi:hypothetical protein
MYKALQAATGIAFELICMTLPNKAQLKTKPASLCSPRKTPVTIAVTGVPV